MRLDRERGYARADMRAGPSPPDASRHSDQYTILTRPIPMNQAPSGGLVTRGGQNQKCRRIAV